MYNYIALPTIKFHTLFFFSLRDIKVALVKQCRAQKVRLYGNGVFEPMMIDQYRPSTSALMTSGRDIQSPLVISAPPSTHPTLPEKYGRLVDLVNAAVSNVQPSSCIERGGGALATPVVVHTPQCPCRGSGCPAL